MYSAIVIGTSAGGLESLKQLIAPLPPSFSTPIIIVQHLLAKSESYLVPALQEHCALPVVEAGFNQPITHGTIFVAPPDYHLLVETNSQFCLSQDTPVNFSMPSIDVLFTSAADVFGDKLIGIVLTGCNSDGTAGLAYIKRNNGYTIVQSPIDATFAEMPSNAIAACKPNFIGTAGEISLHLKSIVVNAAHNNERE